MDGTRDTVASLNVDLRQDVLLVHRGLGNVTDGSGLYHVTDGELLDCLIRSNMSIAVLATEETYVSTPLLVASSGLALLGHTGGYDSLGE